MIFHNSRDHVAYQDLRRAASELAAAATQLLAAPGVADTDVRAVATSLGALEYELGAHCARCGSPFVVIDLLGGSPATTALYGAICTACFFDVRPSERPSSLRAAQLATIAAAHPGRVATALSAALERGVIADYQLDTMLGTDTLGVACLALCRLPRADHRDADIAHLAMATSIAPERIAALLALVEAPPAPDDAAAPDDAG
ncbi:MAG: hypothetical protein RLZZ387_446, partial [Chloroflexota bacterium]